MSISWTADELEQNRRMNLARSGRIVPKGLKAAKCDGCGTRRSPLALYRTETLKRACRTCIIAPADDTYAAAVARTAAFETGSKIGRRVASARKVRAVKTAPIAQPEPVQVPDALSLCNGCDMRPADPDSAAGYCIECERAARPDDEIAAHNTAEPVRKGRHGRRATRRISPRLPTARQYARSISEPTRPEPIPAARPVLTIVQPTTAPAARPTCERCGQTFRMSGNGAEWHRVNRPDCATRAVASA